jgi:hypothetical protein
MPRSYLFVDSSEPELARRAVQASEREIDLTVISPSDVARETADYAVGGRWVFTVREPLLAARVPAESGRDVLERFVQALRGLAAYDAHAVLVVIEGLDLLGAETFTLDGAGLMRSADDLGRALAVR